jgi:hypothetical protein
MSTADLLARIKEHRRHRKQVIVGEDWLRKALRMPEDVMLDRIDYDFRRQSFIITVSHPDWPVVEDFCEPPFVNGHMTPVWLDGKHFGIDDADKKVIVMDLNLDWNDDVHYQ